MSADEFLTVAEAAKIAKVSPETVRRWLRAGRIPGKLLGGTRSGYRIKRSDLLSFLGGTS